MKTRTIAGAVAALLLVAGCAPAANPGGEPSPSPVVTVTPAPSPTPMPSPVFDASAPDPVDAHCDADLVLTVASDVMEASSAGVLIRVTSDAPAGAYLNYALGGDALPEEAEVWTLSAPPGEWEFYCSTLETQGDRVSVTIEDPHGYWSETTPAEAGCEVGAMPSWAVGPGSGTTPDEAAAALMAILGDSPTLTRAQPAGTGYRGAATQTWILGTETLTQVAAQVTGSGTSYVAHPDDFCVGVPWPADVGS